MKIYTKTGDEGKTSLIGGTRVSKNNIRIESYGTVDELNSYVGLVSDMCQQEDIQKILNEVQDRLFTIGAHLACDPQKESVLKIPDLNENDIIYLEKEIDTMNEALEPMKSFILPVGLPAISMTHIARCVCRRAERCCVHLQQENSLVEPIVIKYLNRLSDYLFVLARYIGHINKVSDIPWKARV